LSADPTAPVESHFLSEEEKAEKRGPSECLPSCRGVWAAEPQGLK
jgi:hypothetical protein